MKRIISQVRTPNKKANSRKQFTGEVSNNDFAIHRNISYRNSFLPVINGKLYDDGYRTRVELEMRLHVAVIVLGIVFATGIGVFDLGMFYKQTHIDIMFSIFSVLFPVIALIAFNVEAKIALKKISELIEAER